MGEIKIHHHYDTWGDLCVAAFDAPSHLPDDKRVSREKNRRFSGCDSFEESKDLALNGWKQGQHQIKILSQSLVDKITHTIERVDVNHNIEGHVIDVGRFVEGEPECWLDFTPVQVEGSGHKLIHISFNCCVSAKVSQSAIMRKGAVIAALIELLEFIGHRVKLSVVRGGYATYAIPQKTYVETSANIKDYSQPLDLGRIAFALCHASMLRVVMFGASETWPKEELAKLWFPDSTMSLAPAGNPQITKGDIEIPGTIYYEESWLIQQLKNQGVKFKQEAMAV